MRSRRDDPALPRGDSSDVKPKMIQLDRKIGHKQFMYIHNLSMDRDEPSHLVDQDIHDMEVIGDAISERANGVDQLFVADLSDGASVL